MLKFSNTRDTAKAVLNELNYFKKQYTGKPSDRIKTEKNLWTLAKGGESVSFKYGKYAFMEERGTIYCGVSIEKGLSKELSEYYPKSMIMTEEWFYNSFITKLRIGEVKKVLKELNETIEKPIYIEVLGSTPGVKLDQGGSYTKFEFSGEGVSLVEQLPTVSDKIDLKELNKTPNLKLNRRLSECNTLGEIAEVLNTMEKANELNFILVDIFIWIPFSKMDSTLEGVGLSEEELIKIALKPLNKCIN